MRLPLFLSALLLPLTVNAAAIEQKRALFKELSEIAHQGELATASARLEKLEDYPLYPYLVATNLEARLRQNPGRALDAEIAAFIESHRELPPTASLRYSWVHSLAERERWNMVLTWVNEDDSTTLQCLATTAAIRTQAQSYEELVERALEFWHRGWSQPPACNPVFAWLNENGELTKARIIERARLAVLSSNYWLAEYLADKLPEQDQTRIERWLRVSRSPGNLHVVQQLRDDIAVHAFKHLAHLDNDGAANLISELDDRLGLSAQAVYEMRRYVSLLYAQNHRPKKALTWFAKLDNARMDDFAHSWEARAAILLRDWEALLAAIESMPAKQANNNEWRYWQARALAGLGKHERARRIWRELAEKRAYYGYLAADKLGLEYNLDPDPLPVNHKMRAQLKHRPAIRRARELLALGRRNDAQQEWLLAISDMTAVQLQQAALLARDWGWHPMSIITLARSDYWDDLSVRYPLHYLAEAKQAGQRTNLPPAYVLAIMRTESLFMPEVHSPAGAIGLMQLMPATADQVAANLGLPDPTTATLETPSVNIRLGTHYLRNMLNHFNGYLALATAAYNAGPNAIERWLPETITPSAIWIANIPYTQTRHYVQRVLKHMIAFEARMDQEITKLEDRLRPIPPASEFDL